MIHRTLRNFINRRFTPALETLTAADVGVETLVSLRAVAGAAVRELEQLHPDLPTVRTKLHQAVGLIEEERCSFADPEEPDRLRELFEELLDGLEDTDHRQAPRRHPHNSTYRGAAR